MKKLPYLIALVLILGCRHKPGIFYKNVKDGGKQIIIKYVYNIDGDLVRETQLNENYIGSGYYKEFENGRIRCLGFYERGKNDSSWFYFNEKGDTLIKENWWNGKQFGEQFQFYPFSQFGKYIVKEYSFNNLEGCQLFKMTFDPVSKIKSVKGIPLYLAYNRDTIKANDDFVAICVFGTPPNYTSELQISVHDLSGNIPNSKIKLSDTSEAEERLYFGRKYVQEKRYSTRGRYNWVGSLTIKDPQGKTIAEDSTSVLLTVR